VKSLAPEAQKTAEKSAMWASGLSGESHAAVMLHLRARYVSKAAILTDLHFACRSKIEVPLEFQGLGSLGAASRRRFFPCEFDSTKELFRGW
jgi:hypothetical protein